MIRLCRLFVGADPSVNLDRSPFGNRIDGHPAVNRANADAWPATTDMQGAIRSQIKKVLLDSLYDSRHAVDRIDPGFGTRCVASTTDRMAPPTDDALVGHDHVEVGW